MNSTEELIALCKLGNTAGYTGLYNEHADAVYNTILRLVGHSGEAEDLLQDSFVAAFQRLDQFAMTGGFRAWVKRIAINKSVDLIRKRHINFVELDPGWMTAADESTLDEQDYKYDMARIAAAIDTLPDGYRTVFNLYAVENIPQAEIAQMLGLEHSTVRTQYHRARQKIVAALEKNNDHERGTRRIHTK
ncbi:MAG: RNA polymerase sigma factor [Chitinophagaceae bacterium]